MQFIIREALKRFYDLLQPGGQFGFTVLARSTLYLLHEKLGNDPKWSEYMKVRIKTFNQFTLKRVY
jgi:hypothetical protein